MFSSQCWQTSTPGHGNSFPLKILAWWTDWKGKEFPSAYVKGKRRWEEKTILLLLGCLCLKTGKDESVAPRAHTYMASPPGRRAKGGSPAASRAPALPHCCVHPFSHHLQIPSPACSCSAKAVTLWKTQSSHSGWFLSPRMLNSALKSQTLAEQELLWKGAGLGCQGTP